MARTKEERQREQAVSAVMKAYVDGNAAGYQDGRAAAFAEVRAALGIVTKEEIEHLIDSRIVAHENHYHAL